MQGQSINNRSAATWENRWELGVSVHILSLGRERNGKMPKGERRELCRIVPERSESFRKGSLNRIPLLPKALKRMCKNMHTDPNGANLRGFWDGAD